VMTKKKKKASCNTTPMASAINQKTQIGFNGTTYTPTTKSSETPLFHAQSFGRDMKGACAPGQGAGQYGLMCAPALVTRLPTNRSQCDPNGQCQFHQAAAGQEYQAPFAG
jgi:hypothetical protein